MITSIFNKRIKLILICFFLNIGCQSPSQVTTFSDLVMTIHYRILIGHSLSASDKQQIQAIIDQTFAEVNQIYNKWNPQSELSELNRLKAGEAKILSPQLNNFLLQTGKMVKLTEGRFDPTIEPLQQLWKDKLEQGLVPQEEEINTLQPCLGWDKIHLHQGVFTKEDSRTQIDLGGIAKGWCVDLLVERLNQAGFPNVFVEWGGEIRTSGEHPSHRPWNIYISYFENPDPKHALAYLSLNNQAIATSGDYFQFWTVKLPDEEAKTYTHIFNPQTLYPVEVKPGSIASASVRAPTCWMADALAKVPLLFESLEEAQAWAQEMQQKIPSLEFWIVARPD